MKSKNDKSYFKIAFGEYGVANDVCYVQIGILPYFLLSLAFLLLLFNQQTIALYLYICHWLCLILIFLSKK